MKDWKLRKEPYGYLLMHCCAGLGTDRSPWWYACSYHPKGYWYCLGCRTTAPEEIQFVAELSKCSVNQPL